MKPANKFVICAVIAIVAITCGYLIYYTWSISFGEIDRSNFVVDDDDKEVPYRSSSENSLVTMRSVRTTTQNAKQFEVENDENGVDLHLHRNFNLFNGENCGKFTNSIGDRVVNGMPAKFLANPWIVALYYQHPKLGLRMMCAGSLISGKLNF